jgi:Methyltransferase domain
MLESSARRILAELADDAVVLDLGGWADPFPRADWVIDMMPYESRGLYERRGWVERGSSERERFTRRTWIERDLCDREPFPFEDRQVDFAVCSHTLEDVRDPIWVCEELARVAKAGYLEFPSRLEEQSWGVEGRFVGWGHHRWLVDVGENGLEFVVKPHALHGQPTHNFPHRFWERLTPEERVQTLWWQGELDARERIIIDAHESDAYLSGFVADELAARGLRPPRSSRLRLRRRCWARRQ